MNPAISGKNGNQSLPSDREIKDGSQESTGKSGNTALPTDIGSSTDSKSKSAKS